MSDQSDRRRPARRGGGPRRPSSREGPPETPPRPIILAKPDRDPAAAMKQVDAAIIMVKTRDSTPEPARKIVHSPNQEGLSPQLRLALPQPMVRPVKLLDENFHWSDQGLEFLLDQTDYLVIGVVGLEAAGKSWIMSSLAGKEIFKSTETLGVDMYVTANRIIFLDTQPVLSASVLDMYNRTDRKYPGEYSTAENMAEVQSLQMTSFLYTVCHVVLVVQDWFTDTYFLKFLLTAEMLRPSIPSVGDPNPDQEEFLPHLVLVYNKAQRDQFSLSSVNNMAQTIERYMEKSKLRHRGSVTMAGVTPGLSRSDVINDVNLLLIPDNQKTDDVITDLLPGYKGHPGSEEMLRLLRNQVFQLPRQPFTNAPLTERNWFHYAARMWETVRKSQLIAEYSRLLP